MGRAAQRAGPPFPGGVVEIVNGPLELSASVGLKVTVNGFVSPGASSSADVTPKGEYANADPVTGQAAWFDLRVRIRKSETTGESEPQFPPLAYREADERPLRYGAASRNREHPGKTKP